MKYKYDKEQNTLRQLPEMEEPDYESIKYYNEDFSHKTVQGSIDMAKYREHLSSLKSYPCSGDGWEDGKKYEEGEFEIVEKRKQLTYGVKVKMDDRFESEHVWSKEIEEKNAYKWILLVMEFEKVAVLKQKEDVWEEAIERFTQETGKEYAMTIPFTEWVRQHYTLTPKPITKN